MARWLQDAETGEYFLEDELDPSSYSSVSDWQSYGDDVKTRFSDATPEFRRIQNYLSQGQMNPFAGLDVQRMNELLALNDIGTLSSNGEFTTGTGVSSSLPQESNFPVRRELTTADYEYPSWLTDMPVLGSVPARALGSLAKGAAGLEQLFGDPLGTAEEDRKRAEDLINQARTDSGAEPGSFQDVAATVGGEALAMAPTLGAGLAYNAARGVGRGLGNLYLAALPSALPAGDRYATYRDEGVGVVPAALGAAGNFALDTALNTFDVGQILKPGAASLGRVAQAAGVGGATNVAGAYGGAQVDRLVGTPQTPEEFQQNLIIQGLAGAGTTGALSLLPQQLRAPGEDIGPQGKTVEDFEAEMLADAAPLVDEPTLAPDAPIEANPPLALPAPENQVAGLLPYDRSWVPENWQPGEDFLYRDYAALPPMDPSRPTPLGYVPPEPLNWNYRPLEGGERVFMPEQPLLLDFEGFPQSEMPSWELSPNYNRGTDFQYRDYAALPPAVRRNDVYPQSELPSWELGPGYRRGDNFQYRDYAALPPALIDPNSTAVDKQTATFTTGKTAPAQSAAPIKIGDEAFPQAISELKPQSAQPSMFDEPVQPQVQRAPVEQYGTELTPPLWTELSPIAQQENLPTFVVPLDQVVLDPEIPNFKADAGPTGEVKGKELSGEYNRATGPIVVMRRMSRPEGPFSVVTGRHRRGLKGRLGENTIEVKIIDESPTFGVREAQALDAELNILDGKGSITDYANYFNKSGMNEQEAFKRGLLSQEEGRTGYNIGMKATENVWAAWRNNEIPDRMAASIANAAPLDVGLQAEGLRLAKKGKAQYQIEGALKFLKDFEGRAATTGAQRDMFREGATIQERADLASEIESVKKEIQSRLTDELRSFEAAAKRPELAAKRLNFRDKTPEQLLQEADRLRLEAAKYGDEIYLWPDKLAEVKAKAEERMLKADDSRADVAQRIANKRRQPVSSKEAGHGILHEDLYNILQFIKGRFKKGDDLTGFKDQSSTNQRYSGEGLLGPWRKHLEWMDTTLRKAPQSKGFIEAHWRIPQDMNAMVYDADLTLKPYTSLTEAEMGPVNNFLVAARRRGPEGFKITKDSALKSGLTEKQTEAALAVNTWSKQMLNELYSHAIKGEEQKAFLKIRSAKSPEAQAKIMTEVITKRKEIDDRFNDMLNTNYVPFNRYGEFYVRMRDAQGNVVESRRFEKKGKEFIAAKNHFEQLAKQNGGRIEFGRSDPNPLKRGEYQGVSPDILDILNDDAADVSTKGFYKHLKPIALITGPDGKVTRGVAGESDDLLRSIAEYTTGASKLIAIQRAQRAGEIELATNLAGIDNANLNRRLLSWAEGFSNTDGKFFQGLNQAFNIAYIGGNLRTPTADLLGKIQLQYSMLGKYLKGLDVEKTYFTTIPKEVMWWTQPDKFAAKHPELSKAIVAAQRKGVIPSNVYKGLLRKARGRHNSAALSALDTIHDAYFGLKAFTEKSTDVSAFINGWEAYPKIAKNMPNGSRQQFAENFARESRAVPTQGELPAGFKNPVVRTITKYQLYKAKILKNMMENGWDVRTRYLIATGMTTGLMGLPFVPNAITLSRTEGREPEAALRKARLGDAAIYGPLSALTGIDLSSSAGFGEIFPGSGQDAIQKGILGMAQAPFEQFKRMRGYMDKGQDLQALAATPMMPNLLANIARGADWADRGVMTSSGDALIPKKDVTMRQILARMAGWTPLEVRKEQTLNNIRKQASYLAKDNDNINQRLGEAQALKKWDKVRELEAEARKEDIKINRTQVRKYRDATLGRKNMTIDNAPKKIRREIQDWENLFK